MLNNVEPVDPDDLQGRVQALRNGGWRLVGLTPVPVEGGIELLYHFDRDLEDRHLRLRTSGKEPLPSITPVYPGAFLPENEAQDQFGLMFTGLSPDYRSTFFLEEEADPSPICRGVRIRVERRDEEA